VTITYNIEEIVDLANKDPQPGKITFIAKLIVVPGMQFSYKVQNVKPRGHKQTLEIQQLRTFGKFTLY
jgi:hypothetical protein